MKLNFNKGIIIYLFNFYNIIIYFSIVNFLHYNFFLLYYLLYVIIGIAKKLNRKKNLNLIKIKMIL